MSTLKHAKGNTHTSKVPVIICIFKRHESTQKVLDAVRKYAPDQLFVIADGARNEKEAEKCSKTKALFNDVDWPCQVYKNFSEKNLGGKLRVSSGISWAFEHVDRAIILEDDCVPSPQFFDFCSELLERYITDSRIVQIAGSNFQYGRQRTNYSYYFSSYPLCWGWATWKRAWKSFDIDIKSWPGAKEERILENVLGDRRAERYWNRLFQDMYDGEIKNGWDYRWTLACWLQEGLTITPEKNLVTNIGNTDDAANMQHTSSHLMNLPIETLEFPLKHNQKVEKSSEADQFTFNAYYSSPLLWKLSRKLKKLAGSSVMSPW